MWNPNVVCILLYTYGVAWHVILFALARDDPRLVCFLLLGVRTFIPCPKVQVLFISLLEAGGVNVSMI